jgi:hypothetical protein
MKLLLRKISPETLFRNVSLEKLILLGWFITYLLFVLNLPSLTGLRMIFFY